MPSQRQQLCRRLVEEAGFLDRLTDRRHTRPNKQLFDANSGFAVMERIQHVDERGAHGELGHPVARHPVGRDRPSGASQLEAPDRFGSPGSGDDVEVRVEGARGQDDVNRALVGVDCRDQPTRAFDARLPEELLARGVAFDVQPALGA